ncbi:MAG: glycosyltransferase family 39 protein [Clostridia bacterium]|nr:glycosyltransferase family 39 protein [Clostridia bacterium]
MEKIKKEGLLVMALLFVITAIIMIKPLNDLDEVWNYNFAKNISEGNLPYKDFSIIITPLVPIISSVFLNIFGNELLVMRGLAVILCTAIIYIVYKILERLKVNKKLNYTFIIGLICIFLPHFRIDYNFFVLLNILIIMYIELKDGSKDKALLANIKKDIGLGILAGICICSKQTTGLVVALMLLVYKLVYITNIKEFKLFIKKMFFRAIGVAIPLLVLLGYFISNNIMNDFIDYCILGINTFSNSIPYTDLILKSNLIVKILAVIVPVFLVSSIVIYIKKKCKKEELEYNLLTIIPFALASMIVAFPISDEIHFLVGALPSMISLVYGINILARKIKSEKNKKFLKDILRCCNILMSTSGLITACLMLCECIITARNYTQTNHFKYIIQTETMANSIKTVNEYRESQDKKVYILDATSAIYTIPLDQYTKNYDMFVVGNFGKDGEDGIIEDLKTKEDCIILIKNENHERNWQNPEKVREYIIENMEKIGEVDVFDIYEN